MKKVIHVKNLVSTYHNHVVHDHISFDIHQNEIFGILGSSGAGKSTLMNQLTRLQRLYSGEIVIFDLNLKNLTAQELLIFRKRSAVLFQFGALYSSLNVLENVSFPLLEYTHLSSDLIEDIALAKLSMVGLDPSCALLYPKELSGGMKKRVALARALSLDPELLFLDEPTSGLDPASALAFDELIVQLRNTLGITVVIVTHDLDTIKTALDKFVILHDKKIYFEGSYQEALTLNDPLINEFLKVT